MFSRAATLRKCLWFVIIALIRYEQTRLPEQRVQLYKRAVDTLMETWNYCRASHNTRSL